MHYPWWYVPYLTAPMLIAVIAVLHVLVSHYAVGGGLFLAVETSHAYRTGNREYLAYLHRHARFFVLLTVVFGAITGVGIWWTIGLSSPLATEVLIRTFVFGWAAEWALFVVELLSAFIFLYYWDRLAQRTHAAIGWIYAVAAWLSLVLITGITAFMLNSGPLTDGLAPPDFWTAFFNPQLVPQTIARTGGALLLSSLYVYLHASLAVGDVGLRSMIVSRTVRPAMLGALLVAAGGVGCYCQLPAAAAATLQAAAVLNVLSGVVLAATGVVVILIYLGPRRRPEWVSPGFAMALCLFGVAAFSGGEFIREAIRKPFVVHNMVLGNQLLAREVPNVKKTGFLESGIWTKAYVAARYPDAIEDDEEYGPYIDTKKLLKLPKKDRESLGQTLFLHHCNGCHAAGAGYSPVGLLVQGRLHRGNQMRDAVHDAVVDVGETDYFMPPWCGKDSEAKLLADYLIQVGALYPAGTQPWEKRATAGEQTEDTGSYGDVMGGPQE
jgi:cytochrome bd ubiquinol oxidase subunit I